MGDFNSRTGKYSDSVYHEWNNIITKDQSVTSLNHNQRNSYDKELRADVCKYRPGVGNIKIFKNPKKVK